MQKVKKHPFTLIEIMAVIGIIAVLAGLTVGVSSLVMEKAAEAKTKSTIKMLEMAFEKFHQKNGYYPVTQKEFGPIRFKKDINEEIWKYLDEKFVKQNTLIDPDDNANVYVIDGYGNALVYRYPGYFNKGKFDLGSVGKDKFFGSEKGKAIDESDSEEAGNRFKKGFWEYSDSDITTKQGQIKYYREDFGKGDDIVNFANNAEF